MNTLITGKNITLGYEDQIVARNIDFSVSEGDYLCILGDNGAGKSTLVKAILNLHEPLSGELKFSFDRSKIGYLPQRSQIQRDFPSSVYEVVLSGCVNSLKGRFFYSKEDKKRAYENMDKMDIKYPNYGFKNHKGYPTKAHLDAIKKYGILDNYRFTFGPVRDLIETGGKNERQIRKTNV